MARIEAENAGARHHSAKPEHTVTVYLGSHIHHVYKRSDSWMLPIMDLDGLPEEPPF